MAAAVGLRPVLPGVPGPPLHQRPAGGGERQTEHGEGRAEQSHDQDPPLLKSPANPMKAIERMPARIM